MSIFDLNVKATFLFQIFIRMCWIFLLKPSRGIYAIRPLPNESEPFGSLLWVQENMEIIGSILMMQQPIEFNIVCGYRYIWKFPSLPACEDKRGFIYNDCKYGSININIRFPLAPSFHLLTWKGQCLANFASPGILGVLRSALQVPAYQTQSRLAVAASQVESPNLQVLHLLGGLWGCVITPAIAASSPSVLLSWRFAASVELSTTLLALKALQRCVTASPMRKSCSCCFQNLTVVDHVMSASKQAPSRWKGDSVWGWPTARLLGNYSDTRLREPTGPTHTRGSSAFLGSSYHKGHELPEKLKILSPPTLRSYSWVWLVIQEFISTIINSLPGDCLALSSI